MPRLLRQAQQPEMTRLLSLSEMKVIEPVEMTGDEE